MQLIKKGHVQIFYYCRVRGKGQSNLYAYVPKIMQFLSIWLIFGHKKSGAGVKHENL